MCSKKLNISGMPPQKCGASGIFNRTPIKQDGMKKIKNILFKLNIEIR